MQVTITHAGLAALVNDDGSGTNAVTIVAVAIGDGDQPLDATATALTNEVRRLSVADDELSGAPVDDDVIHAVLRDESTATYTMREFAYILDDGTFFAVYSQPDPIIVKAAQSTVLQPINIRVANAAVGDVTFGSTTFINPPASESMPGVVQRATKAQAEAAEDTQRYLSPLRAWQLVRAGFERSFGETDSKGYIRFPWVLGGLIVQWGVTLPIDAGEQFLRDGDRGSLGNAQVSFPVEFPNACMQVIATPRDTSDGILESAGVSSIRLADFRVWVSYRATQNNSNFGQARVSWLAIGY